MPTTSRQTSATRTDTTSRLPISLGSTNKRYEPSTHLKPAAIIRPWHSATDQAWETAFRCVLLQRRESSRMEITSKPFAIKKNEEANMKVGFIGAPHIGGTLARLAV